MEFYKDKRVLITGHTGFKGSWLCKILSMYGANILGYSLKRLTNPSLYELLELDKEVNSVIGDIRDYDKLKETIIDFKPEIIIHLAAEATVERSNSKSLATYETNTLGTANLLESLRYCDSVKSVVIVSTDAVYKKEKNKHIYIEEDRLKGENFYSNSKTCAELIVENYKNIYFKNKEYPRISITRSVNVIGGGDFNKERILPTCIYSWINNKEITIRNPKNIRPFLDVLETLYGYLLLAKLQYTDKSVEDIYNFSPDYSEYVSIGKLVSMFCKKINIECDIKELEENNLFYKISNEKAKEKLNWYPVYTLDEKLDKIIRWNKVLIQDEDIIKETEEQIKIFFKK